MTNKKKKEKLPLFFTPVKAGFPSPASDLIDKKLDLHSYLVTNQSATFFVKVSGDSMKDAGISSNDILVVDKSRLPKQNDIIVAAVNGEFTVKKYKLIKGKAFLMPENQNYKTIEINESDEFIFWGVVTAVIKKFY